MLGHRAIASAAISSLPEWRWTASLNALLAATDGGASQICAATAEFITRSSDALANTPFAGSLLKTAHVQRSIMNGNPFGKVSTTLGEIELINTDGAYDNVPTQYAIDGRRLLMKVGLWNGGSPVYDQFETLIDATALKGHADENIFRITLRDNSVRLTVPAQPNIYTGTGDLEGGADLANKRKPRAFGSVLNITPAPLIAAELVYQVNDGAVSAVSAVYDSGIALSVGSNHATVAALRAASVTAGFYDTCTAEGLFRLGAAPYGQITADVLGDATGSYVDTVAGIVRRLLTTAGGLADPDDLDVFSFLDLDTDQPATIGYYLGPDDTKTVDDAAGDILLSVGGWGGFTLQGRYRVQRFSAPSEVAAAYYDAVDMTENSFDRPELPESLNPPPWRYRVAWKRNWTQQTNLPGLAEVDAARAAWVATRYNLAVSSASEGAAILTDHILAQDPAPIESYFAAEADAQAEADRLLALNAGGLALYRMVIKRALFKHELGEVINVSYPRWGLDDGRYMRIVSVADDADDESADITAFG